MEQSHKCTINCTKNPNICYACELIEDRNQKIINSMHMWNKKVY